MHDRDDDDELPPWLGERYRDVLAERAIATLDDYAPEPRRKPYKGVRRVDTQCTPESTRGPHDGI